MTRKSDHDDRISRCEHTVTELTQARRLREIDDITIPSEMTAEHIRILGSGRDLYTIIYITAAREVGSCPPPPEDLTKVTGSTLAAMLANARFGRDRQRVHQECRRRLHPEVALTESGYDPGTRKLNGHRYTSWLVACGAGVLIDDIGLTAYAQEVDRWTRPDHRMLGLQYTIWERLRHAKH